MTVLEWDKVGDRVYQSGIDKGVLYLKDGRTVAWNGITSVEDNTDSELKSYYLDGIKILDHVVPGDFSGKISAITYPDELDEVLGVVPITDGVSFYEQKSKSFNLSYRTKIGNDIDDDYGYKIHLLYNLVAFPDSHTFKTLSNEPSVNEFSWSLSGTPTVLMLDSVSPYTRPTVHVTIDSINTRPDILEAFENILYGTPTTAPRFPTILEVRIMSGEIGGLYIIDNGDGTWNAIDSSNDFIESVIDGVFTIDHADVTYLDADTYTITDTEFPLP